MRVTTLSTYRNFTTSVNNVHLNLNKSMNKVSSGKAYESAAESPLNYYTGKKIDNQYQDTLNKISVIKNVQNRIYQQELGARDIQGILSGAKNKVQYALTGTTTDYALESTRDDLYQKQYEIIDSLNMEYEGYFIYGGNDTSVTPFSLKYDRSDPAKPFTFTYSHTFPGDTSPTEFNFELKYDAGTGKSQFKLVDQSQEDLLLQAMSEQGRVDIGYGSIQEKTSGSRDTLLDTYTGGINLLTGITSDAVKTQGVTLADVEKALTNSSLGLIGRAIQTIDYNVDSGRTEQTQSTMHDALGDVLTLMTESEHLTSTVYSDLGNKYRLLDDTKDKLEIEKISLTTQYKDKLGADPYESIMEMYNNQYSYNAALQVGSKLMGSSLFDFMA